MIFLPRCTDYLELKGYIHVSGVERQNPINPLIQKKIPHSDIFEGFRSMGMEIRRVRPDIITV